MSELQQLCRWIDALNATVGFLTVIRTIATAISADVADGYQADPGHLDALREWESMLGCNVGHLVGVYPGGGP